MIKDRIITDIKWPKLRIIALASVILILAFTAIKTAGHLFDEAWKHDQKIKSVKIK